MSGPPPKPRDQRTRRNADEGTTSTSVTLADVAPDPPAWAGPIETYKLDGLEVRVPKAPGGKRPLLKVARDAWVLWWLGPEASMLRPHHLPALRRLVRLYDREERLNRELEDRRLIARTEYVGLDGAALEGEIPLDTVARMEYLPGHLAFGSTGQVVSAPAVAQLSKVQAEIRALEDRFAASPLAQFRVGWQQAEMFNAQHRAAENAGIVEAAQAIAARHEALLDRRP